MLLRYWKASSKLSIRSWTSSVPAETTIKLLAMKT